jgi:hypothetical protein
VVPITKVLQAKDDAVICVYCNRVIPVEEIVWSDGVFHFDVIGNVTVIKVQPRVLLRDQMAPILDFSKILDKAKKIIKSEPNIRCICGEFAIGDDDIRVELILEPK